MEELYNKKLKLEEELREINAEILYKKMDSKSFLSVKDLKEELEGLPDDAGVFCQIISNIDKKDVINAFDGNGGSSDYHSAWSASFDEDNYILKINLIW